MAAGFTDSTIRLWDLQKAVEEQKDESEKPYQEMIGHSSGVYGMDFSSDNRYLLSCGSDNSIRLWTMRNCFNLVAYKGHNFPVWDVSFSNLDHYFASASKYEMTVTFH